MAYCCLLHCSKGFFLILSIVSVFWSLIVLSVHPTMYDNNIRSPNLGVNFYLKLCGHNFHDKYGYFDS